MAELRDVSDEDPFNQVHMPSAFDTFITELVDDLPTVLFGMGAMASSNQFSMANLAILQSSCRSLRTTVSWFLQADEKLRLSAQRVVQMYQTIDKAMRRTGYDPVPYPISEAKGRGMDFELRNVRYEYPGSKTKTPALDNLNFRIPAGSTVVVVGSNGSGKSTLVRILAQLHHPTEGELMIDGHPATAYDISSLRQAVALLSQDNLVYPFSLRENIGLGCSELKDDIQLIEDSAERGGAAEFISKLKSGYDTMLNPMTMTYAINEWKQPDHPVLKRMGDLDQAIDISGGERQG
ncbi:P-loop containing nucleoside triphosphate hydrolase protein [Coprinopsis sp. MPI-PUGE-AT-0042]|nr:P-loop containing nucleoside triphosphate hydrolase protein [Coprinopsis sp. MPI-PUGE-AT-0042]